jgi:hypothetical protein
MTATIEGAVLEKTFSANVKTGCLFKDEDIVGNWKMIFAVNNCLGEVYGTHFLEFKANGSIWIYDSSPGAFTSEDFNSLNGTTGFGSWSLECSGYLSIRYGVWRGGVLNTSGTETSCETYGQASSKLVRD